MQNSVSKNIAENVDFIKDSYVNNISLKCDNFDLITSPFKVLKLRNVLTSPSYKKDLKTAVETLDLSVKNNDLYRLSQSEDLQNCGLKIIKKFLHILKNEIGPLVSNIFSVKLNQKLSTTVSLYTYGDTLLCHDDKCEDRCIAFVYYLTGSDSAGGSFDLFDHDGNGQPTEVVHSISPEEDSFVCFEVGNFTYHQVSEITDDKFQRWSINGWFHSDRELALLKYEDPLPPLHKQITFDGSENLSQLINPLYSAPSNLELMQEKFEEESILFLRDMLSPELYDACSGELTGDKLSWQRMGPANRRYYYSADLNNLSDGLNKVVKLLMSAEFVSFLKKFTSLSLLPSDQEKGGSQFIFELIKWSPGCYTMATDNDEFFKKPGLDLYLFFATECLSKCSNTSGYVTYLDTGDDDETVSDDSDEENIPSDKELITVVPENNALVLVYRTDHTVRFTKYLSKCLRKSYYAIYATYYEVE